MEQHLHDLVRQADSPSLTDDEAAPLVDEQCALEWEIARTVATTKEGVLVKLRSWGRSAETSESEWDKTNQATLVRSIEAMNCSPAGAS